MLSRRQNVLPGFGITMGFTVFYLSLVVLIPLAALFLSASALDWKTFWATTTDSRVLAAYRLSFLASLAAAAINAVFGFIVAWVLVRYTFPGKKIVDAMVDLPFALPTAVSGIALAALYSQNGWIGRGFWAMGIKIANTPIGVALALVFIGLPFVVRTLQPALEDLDPEIEEAAASLGAGRLQTFVRVILPSVFPSLLTGFALAFARALGEYGSVVFIAGNLPMHTEIAPLLMMQKIENHDLAGATVIAVTMLVVAFALLLAINVLQRWSRRYA